MKSGLTPRQHLNASAAAGRGRRRALATLAASVALILIGAGVWRFVLRERPVVVGDVNLGILPAGTNQNGLNLVVITLDTTRADHLGAYGAREVRTPAFDRLAREGVLFEHTTTTAPLTLPAHSSIFTGRFPPEHRVRDNGGFFLSPEETTLAEVLKTKGFRTGGFIGAYVLDGKWGIGQGFDAYFDDFDLAQRRGRSIGSIQRPGNEVVDKALGWLAEQGDQRFFAWVHLFDPHTPYDPPEPFKSQYAGQPYRGEIAFTDAQVGRVLSFLEDRRLLDRTVVVVLGDHGESLGDHGEDAHGFFVYESTTRVPFVIRSPYQHASRRRVADPVRVIDVMPTVLDLLGVPTVPKISGRSLLPLMTGATRELGLEGYAEAMYPLHHYGWSELRALRSGRYKLVDAPRPELFDIARDPGETTNIFNERRSLGETMIGRLRQLEAAFETPAGDAPAADVDPEVRARLAALGYVGSFVASAADPRTKRADPKDKIDLFNLMGSARDAAHEADGFDQTVRLLTRVVREDPQVIDAWFSLGNAYLKQRRYREAIEHFRKALELKPDYDLAVINMASAYRSLGDDEAALAGFQRYLTLDPKDAYVRYQIGEVYLDRGETARAEEKFREALALDDKVAPAKNALGVIAYQRGDLAGAERLIREAIALRSDVRLAHHNLALIFEQRGDLRSAEREYLLELETYPGTYQAAFNLARLYERVGEQDLQVDALRQAIDANPEFAEAHIELARALLRRGELKNALQLATKGLSLRPRPELAPLGHYVVADVYNRLGRRAEAQREVMIGRRLEGRVRK